MKILNSPGAQKKDKRAGRLRDNQSNAPCMLMSRYWRHNAATNTAVMIGTDEAPVNDLPCVGQVSDYLHGDENLFLDVDGADHLVQELSGVCQELTDLQVGLQLVELLDLNICGGERG